MAEKKEAKAKPKAEAPPPVPEGGEEEKKKIEWIRTPQTHLAFIKGFNAFPSQSPGGLNPAILFNAVGRKDTEMARKLLIADGDVNILNTSGSTLCHVAVRTQDPSILKLILAFHPDIDIKEDDAVGGSTPILAAAELGDIRMVRLLLSAKADLSLTNKTGSTSLHISARKGFIDIARLLIHAATKEGTAGPNGEPFVEMVDKQGKSAYYWAKEFGHLDVAELLPAKAYDALEQFDASRKANPVWDPDWKKKQKKAKEKKDGKKGGKDAKKGKKKK